MSEVLKNSSTASEEAAKRKKLRAIAAANRSLEKFLDDSVDSDVRDFLNGYWRNLLSAIYLRRGPESKQWQQALDTVRILLWSLRQDSINTSRSQWLKTVSQLQKTILHALQSMNVSDQESARVMKMLAMYHGYLLKSGVDKTRDEGANEDIEIDMDEERMPTSQKPASPMDDPSLQAFMQRESQRFEQDQSAPQTAKEIQEYFDSTLDLHLKKVQPQNEVEEKNELVDELEDFDALVRASQYEPPKPTKTPPRHPLKPGSWVHMVVKGQEILVKLAMINKITGMYVFVNRKGHKIKEITQEGLVNAIESGDIKTAQGGLKSSSIR